MKKRVFSAFLWFYAGWTLGSLISFAFGISPAIGPVLGAAASALFVGDPRRIIWTRPTPGRGIGTIPGGTRVRGPIVVTRRW